MTKRLSRIRNAWHFWFGLALVVCVAHHLT
ncbi:TPA: DUF3265 domain-containing protein, partial [Vibrio vulnificus]|nr:DUF3265 domain-containing protein [Vibrio vulnificus]